MKKIAGLTITCDHCPATALYRSETWNGRWFDVHWTCDTCDHRGPVA